MAAGPHDLRLEAVTAAGTDQALPEQAPLQGG